MGLSKPSFLPKGQCKDKADAKPIAVGYNEHYAFQQRDGSVSYFVQDREYYKCSVRNIDYRVLSKEEWEATFKDFRYEVMK